MLLEGRRDERSALQAKKIESKDSLDTETNKLESKFNITCYNCGRAFPHERSCPAKGKTCNKWGKQNHFATVCREKPQKSLQSKQKNKTKKIRPKNINPLAARESSNSDEFRIWVELLYR